MSLFNEADQEVYSEVLEAMARNLSSGALQPSDPRIPEVIDQAVTKRMPDLPDKQTDPEGNEKAYDDRMKVADAVFQELRVRHDLPLCRTALIDWRKVEKRKKRRKP